MEKQTEGALPADDVRRGLTKSDPEKLPHVGVAGDTYTILLGGEDTGGRYCLIDMYVPAGGGPPPHRHDFEETFTVLEGELEAVFRGTKMVVRAGETIHIPANAPHQFHNASAAPTRMLCMCAPAGLEEFFLEVGTPVETRTTPAVLDEAGRAAFIVKAVALSPKYRMELL